MLRVNQTSDSQVEIILSGKLDAATMREGLEQWSAATAGMQHGKALYRIGDFEWPTLSAIGVELSMMPELLRSLGRVDRIAVLCDRAWIQHVAEIEGFLIPGLEIKAFEPDEELQAQAWLDAGSQR
jgi:hypothetical protein